MYCSLLKQLHSTENGILKVQNDITLNMANGKVTSLTVSGLTAAFDINNHTVLLDHVVVLYSSFQLYSYFSGRYLPEIKLGTVSVTT